MREILRKSLLRRRPPFILAETIPDRILNVLFEFAAIGMEEAEPVFMAIDSPRVPTIRVPVLRVFDGDGFLARVRMGEIGGDCRDTRELEFGIRFGFIDAPEMDQAGGPEARQFLSSLIEHRWLDLVILTKMDTGRSVDRHGRIVAVPYLEEHYAGAAFRNFSGKIHKAHSSFRNITIVRNIELEMVLNGWAWVLDRYGPDESYLRALDEAQSHKRGIWAHEGNMHPWDHKKNRSRARKSDAGSSLDLRIKCPTEGCNGHLVDLVGRYGPFQGCSAYPKCRFSSSPGD